MRRLSNPLVLALLAASLVVAVGRAAAVDYLIEAQSGGPGTVTPSPNVVVPAGGSQTFTFTPSACNFVADVTVDDVSLGSGLTEYTFTNVQSDHVLYVSFGPHAQATTTTLDVRPVFGQCAVPETLTATVMNADGGQVQFLNGGALLGTRTLTAGVATYVVVPGLPTGSYAFTANYLGTNCSSPSNSPTVLYDVADTGPTPVTLSLTLSSDTLDQHALVSAIAALRIGEAGAFAQNGQVTFYDGGISLGTFAMTNGHSSRSVRMDSPGVHVFTAVASLVQCPGTITSEPQTVFVRENTSLSLIISPMQIDPGDSALMTAVVNPWYATGSIHFLDVTTTPVEVGTASLVDGIASFTYSPLWSRTIEARYDGNAAFLGSTSNRVLLQVQEPPPPPIDTKQWFTDGIVKAAVTDGSTIYIGGDFRQVGPVTGSAVAIDASTAAVQQPYPLVSGGLAGGFVWAVAPDGSGGWYLGGSFTSVRGLPRKDLAHLDAAGNVTPWNPNPDGTSGIVSLVVSGGTVYVSGYFTSIGGKPRNYIAALDATSGAATAWNPGSYGTLSDPVQALAVSGNTVYAAGNFFLIAGQQRNRIAALDATTGAATAWNPNANNAVHALAVSGGTVYAGGAFTTIGGQTRHCIAALDASSGAATAWNPDTHNDYQPMLPIFISPVVYALAVNGGTVYAGGIFTDIGGQARNGIAAIDAITGAATAWNPNPNLGALVRVLALSGGTVYVCGSITSIGGQPRNYLAALDATSGAATAWNPNPNRTVYGLAVSGGTVYVGGNFTSIGRQVRNSIAALDATTGAATAWNPNANGAVSSLALSGGTVYAGGTFSSIGGQLRSSIAALDGATGAATAWNPNAAGTVAALALSKGTVYAGGSFSNIGGLPRNNIAAIDGTTGAATAWNPNSGGTVAALAASGGTVYAGGDFTTVGGQPRNNIAAIDVVTAAATAWNPNSSGTVAALSASVGTVYAGGNFTSIGGQPRNYIAAIDATTGAATAWNPNSGGTIAALAVSGGTVYTGGNFGNIGGHGRSNIAALDAATGAATAWNPNANGSVDALALSAGTVYAGGDFTSIGGLSQSYFAGISGVDIPLSAGQRATLSQSELTLLSPNPTSGGTQVRYGVARPGRVRLEVLDVAGRVEETLADRIHTPGRYVVSWDGVGRRGRLAPGLHFVRFVAPDRVMVRKLAIIR